MRIFPRTKLPTPKAARRLWRKSKGHFTLRRLYYSAEIFLFTAIYFVVFTGRRLRFIDSFGRAGGPGRLADSRCRIHRYSRPRASTSPAKNRTALPARAVRSSARSSSISDKAHITSPASISFINILPSESETHSTQATQQSSFVTKPAEISTCECSQAQGRPAETDPGGKPLAVE